MALNSAIRTTFGSRTPITYLPSTGATSVGNSYTVNAVIESPHVLDARLDGAYVEIWVDGNDPALPGAPVNGDLFKIADGTIYSVQRIEVDTENGILMLCRLKNRPPGVF